MPQFILNLIAHLVETPLVQCPNPFQELIISTLVPPVFSIQYCHIAYLDFRSLYHYLYYHSC